MNKPRSKKDEISLHEVELEMQNAELRETQEKLSAALLEYSELFELSPVGYYILDEKGVIENVNIRAHNQLGADKKYLIKKSFCTFLSTELDQDNFYRHMNLAIEEGALERMQCEMKKKDGTVFSALLKSKVMRNEKLQFKHLLSMVSDISSIKEHEHLVELQLIKSEELNTMKSRFINMASHEFRTPLTSILSSTALIEQYWELGEAVKMKRHLTRIKSSVKNLVNVIDEFLSIEKLESGKVEIHRVAFSLPELCDDLMEEIASVKKNGQVIYHNHAGSNEIYEDRNIIRHILLNLLSNACKYSAEERDVNLMTIVSDKQVTIIVEDRGIGIPEAEHAYVFTSFFRAGNTGNIDGTGLGLNIVKRYVELLEGTISFISKQNKGTTFTVEFQHN
jgi:two-component system sensor kinase FixL